jgi:hypothetical protein
MESLHMRTIRNILMICSLSLLLPVAASAQSLSEVQAMSKEDRRSYIEAMSEDERSAMRDKWRAEFEQLPEEQKAAIREQRQANGGGGNRDRKEMRQRWESMSEEEQAAAREKRRANWESMSEEERAAYREKRGGHKGQQQGGQRKGNAGAGEVESGVDPER